MSRRASITADEKQGQKRLAYQDVQMKAFTRWVNTHLDDRGLAIESLTDFGTGVYLCNLMEIISGKPVKHKKNAKNRMFQLENINSALRFIKYQGVKLVNIGTTDIFDGNKTCLLGLVWTLILRYQINKRDYRRESNAGNSGKAGLMAWVNDQILPLGLSTRNFTSSYQDPQILTALVNVLEPNTLDLAAARTSDEQVAIEKVETALNTAEERFEIPRMLDGVDIVAGGDELAMMTYVSYYRSAWEKRQAEAKSNRQAQLEDLKQRNSEAASLKECDPSQSFLRGDSDAVAALAANGVEEARIIVVPVTKSGKEGAEVKTCEVRVLDENGQVVQTVVDPELIKNPDGTFTATIHVPSAINAPGTYALTALINDEEIKDVPLQCVILRQADPSKSFMEGPALELLQGAVEACGFSTSAPGQLETKQDNVYDKTKVLFILPQQQGQEETEAGWNLNEVAGPYRVFTDAGYQVEFATEQGGETTINAASHQEAMASSDPDIVAFLGDAECMRLTDNTLSSLAVDPVHYAAVYYPGGSSDHSLGLTALTRAVYEDQAGVVGGNSSGVGGLAAVRLASQQPLVSGKQVAVASAADAAGSFASEQGAEAVAMESNDKPHVCVADRVVTGGNSYSAVDTAEAMLSLLQPPTVTKMSTAVTVQALGANEEPIVANACEVLVKAKINPTSSGAPLETDVVPVVVTDNKNGSYTATWEQDLLPGEYEIVACLNGKNVKNSPQTFSVKARADITKCKAKGPGLKGGKHNNPKTSPFASFHVFARDQNKRPIVPAPACDVQITGPQGEALEVTIVECGAEEHKGRDKPSFKVSYPRGEPGNYHIDVQIDSKSIKGMPKTVKVKKGASAKDTEPSCKFKFTIVARDDEGGISEGGDLWEVKVHAEAGADEEVKDVKEVYVRTRDHGDGRYSAEYTLKGHRLFVVQPVLNGEPLNPFTHDMRQNVSDEEDAEPETLQEEQA